MMPPPGLKIYHWPRVTLTFDLLYPSLYPSCCEIMGTYCNIFLQYLTKIRYSFGDIWRCPRMTFDLGPKVTVLYISLVVVHLRQVAPKSTGWFIYRISCKFVSSKRTDERADMLQHYAWACPGLAKSSSAESCHKLWRCVCSTGK